MTPRSFEILQIPDGIGLPSPKLTVQEKRTALYPYYAAFSGAFVKSLLEHIGAQPGCSILDPWNGSGTTTAVASSNRLRATGIDLNPALNHVAITRSSRAASINLVNSIVERRLSKALAAMQLDPRCGFHPISTFHDTLQQDEPTYDENYDEVDSAIYTLIFKSIRRLSAIRKLSNPTWFKIAKDIHVSSEDFELNFRKSFQELIILNERQPNTSNPRPTILTDNFQQTIHKFGEKFDYVVTSPPYLTRIDYVKATLPELTYLDIRNEVNIDKIRSEMIGTPITKGVATRLQDGSGSRVENLMAAIEGHPSKASSTYYKYFYQKYFFNLHASLKSISECLKPGGIAAIIVQTSHYKEIFIDLPGIVSEMAANLGMDLTEQIDFNQKRSMLSVNRRSFSSHNKLKIVESVVIFRKNR